MKDLKTIEEVKQYKNYKPLECCQIVVSNFNVVIYTNREERNIIIYIVLSHFSFRLV